MGRKVPKVVKRYVKRCMTYAIEKKNSSVVGIIGNFGLPTTAGRVDEIQTFSITQGDGNGNRTGNTIKPVRLDLRFTAQNPATNLGPMEFRVLLVQDRQTNGALPGIAEIFTQAGGALGGYNPDTVIGSGGRRFKILRDSMFCINTSPSVATTFTTEKMWKWSVFERELAPIHYDGTAGTIADLVSGSIYIVTLVNDNDGIVQCVSDFHYRDA